LDRAKSGNPGLCCVEFFSPIVGERFDRGVSPLDLDEAAEAEKNPSAAILLVLAASVTGIVWEKRPKSSQQTTFYTSNNF
jgi:hypothetical protein